jgi:hypothetical protein
MAINWDDVESKYASQYKDYAEDGTYKVKCDGVEMKEAGSKGNVVLKFHFEETDDVQFPTADHWMSKDNNNWRIHHMKELLIALGTTEEKARKCCEMAESKDSFDYATKAYKKAFDTLLAKKPEVEIEVYTEGKYARAEFTNRNVAMRRDNDAKAEDPMADAEEISDDEIDLSDVPF